MTNVDIGIVASHGPEPDVGWVIFIFKYKLGGGVKVVHNGVDIIPVTIL